LLLHEGVEAYKVFRSEGEQQSEGSDAGVMIVQEVFGFVERGGPGEMVRSEAEELRREFGVHSTAPLSPAFSMSKRFIPCFFDGELRFLHMDSPRISMRWGL